jgi:hypothetical protein
MITILGAFFLVVMVVLATGTIVKILMAKADELGRNRWAWAASCVVGTLLLPLFPLAVIKLDGFAGFALLTCSLLAAPALSGLVTFQLLKLAGGNDAACSRGNLFDVFVIEPESHAGAFVLSVGLHGLSLTPDQREQDSSDSQHAIAFTEIERIEQSGGSVDIRGSRKRFSILPAGGNNELQRERQAIKLANRLREAMHRRRA